MPQRSKHQQLYYSQGLNTVLKTPSISISSTVGHIYITFSLQKRMPPVRHQRSGRSNATSSSYPMELEDIQSLFDSDTKQKVAFRLKDVREIIKRIRGEGLKRIQEGLLKSANDLLIVEEDTQTIADEQVQETKAIMNHRYEPVVIPQIKLLKLEGELIELENMYHALEFKRDEKSHLLGFLEIWCSNILESFQSVASVIDEGEDHAVEFLETLEEMESCYDNPNIVKVRCEFSYGPATPNTPFRANHQNTIQTAGGKTRTSVDQLKQKVVSFIDCNPGRDIPSLFSWIVEKRELLADDDDDDDL